MLANLIIKEKSHTINIRKGSEQFIENKISRGQLSC